MRLLLVGNYGVKNLGDELLREYFLKTFREVEWIVLSAHHTQYTIHSTDYCSVPRLPFGLRSLLKTPWWRTIGALRRCDGMVFGGGTLFTDIESLKAPLLWWWHALWARFLRKKIILAFQGIGPFRTRVGEWCSRWVVARAELVILRDAESFSRIASWQKQHCVLSFDPVLSLFAVEKRDATGSIFVVIPRASTTQEFHDATMKMWEQRTGAWDGARIVSLEPDNADEHRACASLARLLQTTVVPARSLEALKDALGDAAFVLTQRYHGAIAALGMGIALTAVAQHAGDKLDALQGVDRSEALTRIEVGEQALRAVFLL